MDRTHWFPGGFGQQEAVAEAGGQEEGETGVSTPLTPNPQS